MIQTLLPLEVDTWTPNSVLGAMLVKTVIVLDNGPDAEVGVQHFAFKTQGTTGTGTPDGKVKVQRSGWSGLLEGASECV
jgi:hypothetical protein